MKKIGKLLTVVVVLLSLVGCGCMKKTAKGAVWLDPDKTSPYDFYQYWRNVDDADVIKCIKMLTFLPLEEREKMESWEGAQLNKAKEVLAYELTKLVHGEDEAKKADETAKSIFSGGDAENMPLAELSDENFKDGAIDVISLVFNAGLATSKSDARRAVEQGGVTVDGEKVTSIDSTFARDMFIDGLVVKKGKKSFRKVVVK